jgi:hypothetical protein
MWHWGQLFERAESEAPMLVGEFRWVPSLSGRQSVATTARGQRTHHRLGHPRSAARTAPLNLRADSYNKSVAATSTSSSVTVAERRAAV